MRPGSWRDHTGTLRKLYISHQKYPRPGGVYLYVNSELTVKSIHTAKDDTVKTISIICYIPPSPPYN